MMASPVKVRCPICKGSGRPVSDGETSLGEPRYWCRQCYNGWIVKDATRRVASEETQSRRPLEEGFIPWGALDPGIKNAYAETGARLRRGQSGSGQGPGSSVGRATKLLGMKPCRGCRGRIEALDDLGWLPVVLYTGAVAGVVVGFTLMAQWLMP